MQTMRTHIESTWKGFDVYINLRSVSYCLTIGVTNFIQSLFMCVSGSLSIEDTESLRADAIPAWFAISTDKIMMNYNEKNGANFQNHIGDDEWWLILHNSIRLSTHSWPSNEASVVMYDVANVVEWLQLQPLLATLPMCTYKDIYIYILKTVLKTLYI